MYRKTALSNRLTVVSCEMPQRVSTALGIWVKVGSRYEDRQRNGISHFLEHLLFKGTKKRSCEDIKQSIEGVGGCLNAFTAEEFTCYFAKLPARYLNSALEVLIDMVFNAKLASEDIETERKVILEEIRMYKDLPGYQASELLTKLLWPRHPLGMSILGETENIRAITRAQLLDCKQNFYQLANVIVAVCGNLAHQKIVQQCQRYDFLFKNNPAAGFSPAGKKQHLAQLKLVNKDTEQTHLALGVQGLARSHPQRYCLGLLHIILGANMSSRLFREVREARGLAYEIGTAIKFFQDSGAFIVHAGIDNRRQIEAIEVIVRQLSELKKNKVSHAELSRAKQYYIGQLILALEETSDHMLWLGENFVSLNRLLRPREIIQQVQQITSGDLQNLAKKILQNRSLNLALVGPLKDRARKLIKQRLILK